MYSSEYTRNTPISMVYIIHTNGDDETGGMKVCTEGLGGRFKNSSV